MRLVIGEIGGDHGSRARLVPALTQEMVGPRTATGGRLSAWAFIHAPRWVDKGYDSKATRAANRRRIDAVIRYKSNAKDRPTFFANLLNKARVRIEQPVGKLKRF